MSDPDKKTCFALKPRFFSRFDVSVRFGNAFLKTRATALLPTLRRRTVPHSKNGGIWGVVSESDNVILPAAKGLKLICSSAIYF